MPSPIVFFDIAGPDADALRQFYAQVFDWDVTDQGRMAVETMTPLGGTFREDPAEHRIYFGVESVDQALNSIEAHGGSIDVPRFEVSGVVILGLFRDPAGNTMGLVEMQNGSPKIP